MKESNVDDGKRESEHWEGCQANPEVMNEPVIKCLCSDALSVSLNQIAARSHQMSETIKTPHWAKKKKTYDSSTHQINSAEVFMMVMRPTNTTKRMERRKQRQAARSMAQHSSGV